MKARSRYPSIKRVVALVLTRRTQNWYKNQRFAEKKKADSQNRTGNHSNPPLDTPERECAGLKHRRASDVGGQGQAEDTYDIFPTEKPAKKLRHSDGAEVLSNNRQRTFAESTAKVSVGTSS